MKGDGKRINGAAKENHTLQKVVDSNMITREVSKMTKDTGSGSTCTQMERSTMMGTFRTIFTMEMAYYTSL